MKILKHPSLNTQYEVDDAHVEEWLAAGWQPLLNEEQQARLDEIEAEVEARYCPTCGASGDDPCRTSSGAVAAKPHAARAE